MHACPFVRAKLPKGSSLNFTLTVIPAQRQAAGRCPREAVSQRRKRLRRPTSRLIVRTHPASKPAASPVAAHGFLPVHLPRAAASWLPPQVA
jgi:hypothetical protein